MHPYPSIHYKEKSYSDTKGTLSKEYTGYLPSRRFRPMQPVELNRDVHTTTFLYYGHKLINCTKNNIPISITSRSSFSIEY